MIASREVSTYVDCGREYSVIAQVRPEDRRTPNDLANVFVRAGDGSTLVPLSALVSASEKAAAPELRRYDRLPSITIQAALAEGYALGNALACMEEGAARILPAGARLGYAGQSLVLTLFLTPVLYDLLARFSKPRSAVERALEAELAGQVPVDSTASGPIISP